MHLQICHVGHCELVLLCISSMFFKCISICYCELNVLDRSPSSQPPGPVCYDRRHRTLSIGVASLLSNQPTSLEHSSNPDTSKVRPAARQQILSGLQLVSENVPCGPPLGISSNKLTLQFFCSPRDAVPRSQRDGTGASAQFPQYHL